MWSYSAGGSILAGGGGALVNICLTVHTKVARSTGASIVVEPILGEKYRRREDDYMGSKSAGISMSLLLSNV